MDAMNSYEQYNARVDRIMSLGIVEELAAQYASLIGDIHRLDDRGNVMVVDLSGRHVATLPASILAPAAPLPSDG